MTPLTLCVDASLALLLYLPDPRTPAALALWQAWRAGAARIVAPPLFFAEVPSVLRSNVYFGHVTAAEGDAAFQSFLLLPVEQISPAGLSLRAWTLAQRYNRPKAYDAQYLALASSLGCELWTADERLANAVPESWVRLAR